MLKVLKSIQIPKPLDDVPSEPEDEEANPEEAKATKLAKPKQTKTKAATKENSSKNAKATGPPEKGSAGMYKAGSFNEEFRAFLEKKKAKGHNHKDSLELWKSSKKRATLLEHMPLAERKRRRFA